MESANVATMFDTRQCVNLVRYELSNSGASSHFLLKGSQAVNVKLAEYPIAIKFPNGSIIWSNYTCNLNIPWLPHKMTEVYIIPDLQNLSLISKNKLCKAGCKGRFDKLECRVYYRNKLVLSRGRVERIEM